MREIEVKARLTKPDQTKKALAKLGIKFNKPDRQVDLIYSEIDWDFGQFTTGRNIVRIRQQSGRTLLTLKRAMTNDQDSLEHELAIADPQEMARILKLMGYQLRVKLKKYRQKARYKNIEICLDEVDQLGSFIELERLADDHAEAAKIQTELFTFLKTLGIKDEEREKRGYDTLMWLKKRQTT